MNPPRVSRSILVSQVIWILIGSPVDWVRHNKPYIYIVCSPWSVGVFLVLITSHVISTFFLVDSMTIIGDIKHGHNCCKALHMFCCAVCHKKVTANLHPGGHIYSVPEETIPGDFVWYDDNRKTIDWCTCLLWVFFKIRLSSLICLPGHLAAHNSRSCGSGVHLKMGGVRIGLGGRWLIGDVLLNVPPSLFADAVEDCGAGGHRELQPSGRGRGAQSEIHGDNQVNYTPERGAQLLNLGRVFVPISHWKAWGDHVGIVDCFNLQ